MGHIGLTPQSATMLGGFKAQGRTAAKAQRLDDDALRARGRRLLRRRARGGAARRSPSAITEALAVPTIGIGAGRGCDGQVLVWHDLLGLYDRGRARFVKRYAEVGAEIRRALEAYAGEVRSARSPPRSTPTRSPRTELEPIRRRPPSSASALQTRPLAPTSQTRAPARRRRPPVASAPAVDLAQADEQRETSAPARRAASRSGGAERARAAGRGQAARNENASTWRARRASRQPPSRRVDEARARRAEEPVDGEPEREPGRGRPRRTRRARRGRREPSPACPSAEAIPAAKTSATTTSCRSDAASRSRCAWRTPARGRPEHEPRPGATNASALVTRSGHDRDPLPEGARDAPGPSARKARFFREPWSK